MSRLNKKEEKMLNYLKEYFHCDSSTLLKKSLFELYEDLKNQEAITAFEEKEKDGNNKFISFKELFD
jgi:hypothetical protein